LVEHRQRNNTINGFKGAEPMATADLLVADCDILIPAATENVITSKNVDGIKAKIIAEGANGPTTAPADEVLAEKKVFVIPDILANAGGVTTSYFEWVQDRQGYFWKEAVVNDQLETIMVESFDEVVRYAETHGVNNRIAAYMLAIDRVAFTIKQRGIYA
jgi:glutamate dehydrogenase (NAD(P)+)